MKTVDLIEDIRRQINNSPENYPFIAPMWEITIGTTDALKVAHYSKHKTKSHITRPFYKPISKIFDIGKLEEYE